MNINESKVSEYIEAEKELKELKDKYKQAKDAFKDELNNRTFYTELTKEGEKLRKEYNKISAPYSFYTGEPIDNGEEVEKVGDTDEKQMLKDHPEAQELIDKLDKLGKDMHAEYVKKEAELKLKYSIKELEDQIKAKEEELKILLDASKKEVIEGDDKVPEQIFKELKDNYLDSSGETKVETVIYNGFVFAELKVIEKDVDITDEDFGDEEGDFRIGSLGEDFAIEVEDCLESYIKDKDFKEGEESKTGMGYHIPETSWWICGGVDEGDLVGEEPTANFHYYPATRGEPEEWDADYSSEEVDIYTTIYLRKKVEN